MKKLFIAAFGICIFTNVFGQLKIGIRVAPQITWSKPDNKNTSTNGTRVNFAYGITIDDYFTDNYGIGTEFSIQTFGTNLSLDQSKFVSINHGKTVIPATESLKYDYRLKYIQIPLLIKMRTKEIGNFRYYAEFGIGSGFLTRAKADVSMGSFAIDDVNINEPDDADKFTIEPTHYEDGAVSYRGSMLIGAGMQYNIFGDSYLIAGLRFDNAFTSFTEDDRWKTNLNCIALNVGILF